MLARSAEKNPSIFSPSGPVCNVTQVIPKLLNIAQRIDNPWNNTKFLLTQFKPSSPPISNMNKAERREILERVNKSKSVAEFAEVMGIELGLGKTVMDEIEVRIKARTQPDIFEERKEAEHNGAVVDEIPDGDAEKTFGERDEKPSVDGFQVGVGPASLTA